MSRQLDDIVIGRYSNPIIIDHLASNYVMGLLDPLVKRRVERLVQHYAYRELEKRIEYWELKLSPLDNKTPDLVPLEQTWQKIHSQLNLDTVNAPQSATTNALSAWWSSVYTAIFSKPAFTQGALAFSLVLCMVLGFTLTQPADELGKMSYVAVLQDDNQTPQVVAATYGESKQLVLDILSLPQISDEESFELWVTSKTDNQTRSLGEIPKGKTNFDRDLTNAEWRLIADSSYLVISIEDQGGSAIGEPSENVISRGLCIRLADRQEQS